MSARRVLVVDDSKSVRTLLTMALAQNGCEVTEAEDGQAALEVLDGRPLDVVVCDLNMPRLDGMGFLRELRLDPRYRRVPVLVLTTETRDERKLALRTGGAQAYLKKPCHPGDLLDAVNRLCH